MLFNFSTFKQVNLFLVQVCLIFCWLPQWKSPLSDDKNLSVSHLYCKQIHQPCVVLTLWRLSCWLERSLFSAIPQNLSVLFYFVSFSLLPPGHSDNIQATISVQHCVQSILPLVSIPLVAPHLFLSPSSPDSSFLLLPSAYLKRNAIVLLPYPKSFNDCPQLQKWNLQGRKLSLSTPSVLFLYHPSLCSRKDELAVRFQSGPCALYLFTFCHLVPYFYWLLRKCSQVPVSNFFLKPALMLLTPLRFIRVFFQVDNFLHSANCVFLASTESASWTLEAWSSEWCSLCNLNLLRER